MRYFGYVRASKDEQKLTLEAQTAQLQAWGAAFDHTVEIHVEGGVSGAIAPLERPVLGALLARLDAKEADGLVAVKLDRLSRSTRDVIDLVTRAENGGWALVCKNDSLDTGSATGRFVVRLLGSLAELERDLICERTKAALGAKRARGEKTGGAVPFGYKVKDGKLEPDLHERFLRDIASLKRRQGNSLLDIAFHFDCNGYKSRSGRPWSRQSVSRLINAKV